VDDFANAALLEVVSNAFRHHCMWMMWNMLFNLKLFQTPFGITACERAGVRRPRNPSISSRYFQAPPQKIFGIFFLTGWEVASSEQFSEWGMGSGEWGIGNGEWGVGSGEWGMAGRRGSGEWGRVF
jgi:hypothetical protein